MTDAEWRWVGYEVTLALHERQIAEHGGLPGVKDAALVESALARPLHLAAYGSPDLADLAAAYAYGLARNHGFSDGNKRVAFMVALLFLRDNGFRLAAPKPEAAVVMLDVAAGELTEAELAAWFRLHLKPV